MIGDPSAGDTTLIMRRTFAAPRERVFRAWTDPVEIRQWFGPGAVGVPEAEVNLRVGGRYRIVLRRPGEEPFSVHGVFQEISIPEKVVYTWQWDAPHLEPAETRVTVEFHDLGEETEIVLTHERFSSAEWRDRHSNGWTGSFEKLAAHLV